MFEFATYEIGFPLYSPMRKASLFILLHIIVASATAQQHPPDSLLLNQIKQLDHAHAEAIFHSDAAALDTLMSDDVTVNHPTNKIVKEKAELLSLIKKVRSGILLLSVHLSDFYFMITWSW
jgi:hypothetical protein